VQSFHKAGAKYSFRPLETLSSFFLSFLHLLLQYTFLIIIPSTSDFARIVGEVKNDTGSAISNVEIAANLLDSSRKLVATVSSDIELEVMAVDSTGCFEILMPNPPAGITDYNFQPPAYELSNELEPSLIASGVALGGSPGDMQRVMTGQVRNAGESTVADVSVVGMLYDKDNRTIGCESSGTVNTQLGPDEISTFEISFSSVEDTFFYKYQAQGHSQE
jgi:hypothetical protein